VLNKHTKAKWLDKPFGLFLFFIGWNLLQCKRYLTEKQRGFIAREKGKRSLMVEEQVVHCPKEGKKVAYGKRTGGSLPKRREKDRLR